MTENPTLFEALVHYQKNVSILHKGYEQECYRIARISRSPMAQKPIRDIQSPDIASYRDQRLADLNPKTGKPISPATVRLEMSLLSSLWEIGRIEWGICGANPIKDVRKPKAPPGRERRLLPREERLILRHALQHPNPELFSLVVLAVETAMRQGELLKLDWEHINLRTRVAHLPETKNGSRRDVPLSLRARDALTRLGAKPCGRVFSYTSAGLKSTWKFMLNKLGIKDLHFHDLRHEACSRLFELGTLDIMEIAAISGHKSLTMLKRYTHLRASRLVRKLEGKKRRGHQEALSHLIPYPAAVLADGAGVEVRVLDFDDVVGRGECETTALEAAQAALLRRLVLSMRDQQEIPPPDQYLEAVDPRTVVMLDPLLPVQGRCRAA
ncbi:site-specific integrase [Metapseudomonas furukawaii]|uniref:Shufflon-specific DNA recombinase n=1 Tax=Metapseudomonas furukawaii TaxID=1149133 RepID=A0AAD1C5Y8_METFU|nr:site-specific integrase [Pseudomonas furukawaii]ELS26289.1 Shufflon-specific DNA recombinase [Pseudomonas furukawaii]BAU77400.1 shufflon-specific DNA recombinase [Pseudomonas furukawaii]